MTKESFRVIDKAQTFITATAEDFQTFSFDSEECRLPKSSYSVNRDSINRYRKLHAKVIEASEPQFVNATFDSSMTLYANSTDHGGHRRPLTGYTKTEFLRPQTQSPQYRIEKQKTMSDVHTIKYKLASAGIPVSMQQIQQGLHRPEDGGVFDLSQAPNPGSLLIHVPVRKKGKKKGKRGKRGKKKTKK